MAKKYHVSEYGQFSVTLREQGVHLAPRVVTLQRAAISSVTKKFGHVEVVTTAGERYYVLWGIRADQQQLTAEAFGISV